MNDPKEDNIDWARTDAQWVLENRPLRLDRGHIQQLELKHGVERAHTLIQERVALALRGVRMAPPHRGGRR